MLLDVGMTLRERVPSYKLTRAALSLETPDGKTVPLPSNEDFQKANLMALERRSQVTKDSINYFPPMASQACRIGFFAELAQRAMSYDQVELSPTRACLGKLYFPIAGGIKHGRSWLNVKFEKSLVRVPLRILTKDEEKLLNKNYKDIKKQVEDAFAPPKKKSGNFAAVCACRHVRSGYHPSAPTRCAGRTDSPAGRRRAIDLLGIKHETPHAPPGVS